MDKLIGWVWNTKTAQWEEGFAALKAYVAEHGHARVPKGFRTETGMNLGTWVNNRRTDRRIGTLDQERAERLDALGDWASDATAAKD